MGQFIDFAYVKQHADFAAILAHYNLTLTGTGDERRCCCPFHEDARPSMTVNVEKGVYHCHASSCGEEGNVLEFVAGMEGSDLRSAASTIGDICNINLAAPRHRNSKAKVAKKKAAKVDRKPAMKADKAPVEATAPASEVNTPLTFSLTLDRDHEYGASRSLSSSVIELFEMGYAGKGTMAGRWCVPIHTVAGDLVAYIGRYAADPVPEDEIKYKLPKGFNKDLELFNLHRVAEHSKVAVLVEGVFDAIRLYSLAMPAVALLGSSISDAQIALLKASGFTSAVVLLDCNTVKAERKLVHRVSREMFVRSVALPDGDDPATVSEGFLREHVPVFDG